MLDRRGVRGAQRPAKIFFAKAHEIIKLQNSALFWCYEQLAQLVS